MGKKLEEAGVNFKKFETFISTGKFYVGRRMHHKVLVIDEKIAMVGGMNIADRYRGTKEVPAWLDYAVVVEGPICKNLALACTRILEKQFNPAKPKWPKIFAKSNTLDTSKVWVRMRKNDWLRNRREITSSYNKAARLATKSITIVGGYFIPGRKYRRLLADASKRGVEIRIILTHYSDVPVVKYASDYLYGWLLKNNIRIFESKELMVHGKVAIVDETWATVGSYNQNHLSAYLSIELNLDIVNTAFAKEFNDHLLHVINTECIEVTHDSYYSKSSWYSKLKRWISYQLVRISLRMLFVVNRIFYVDD
ncbi:MAG: phospholipase [Bacteroidetes bacterium]|nr:phospholipase [Bacteroidota bacterium]